MNPVEPMKQSKKIAYEVSGPSESQKQEGAPAEGLSPSEEGSLQKVRDILFGAQSREFDQRCSELENRLLQESTDLRDKLTRSLEDLKAHFTQEISSLNQKIQQEQANRTSSLAEAEHAVQTLGQNLKGELSKLHEQTSQQYAALERQGLQQKAELTEHSDQRFAELQRQFQEGLQVLKTEKTDRAVLAEMLMELALRLKVGTKDESSS